MGTPEDGSADRELKARLDKLSNALDAQRDGVKDKASDEASARGTGQAMSLGIRVMSEFVAAIAVSALFGWQADEWLGTSPAFLIVMLAMGTAAGFWNVYRLAAAPTGDSGGKNK